MIPPASDLRPVVVSTDTPERFAAWRAMEGQAPDALACVGLADTHLVCLRVWEQARRRFVLRSDLTAWKTDAAQLLREVAAASGPAVDRAELRTVEGGTERYLELVDRDGWAGVGLLRPDLVSKRLGGGPIRVAVPVEGVLLAWSVTDPKGASELDRVMAVGVREWFDRAEAKVSPRMLTWDGTSWTTFGEAVPRNP